MPIDLVTETEWPWTVVNVRPIETCFNVPRPEHLHLDSQPHELMWPAALTSLSYGPWFIAAIPVGDSKTLSIHHKSLVYSARCSSNQNYFWLKNIQLINNTSIFIGTWKKNYQHYPFFRNYKILRTSTTPHVLNMAPFQDWCTHVANKKRQLIILGIQNPNSIWFLSIFFRRDVLTWETWKPGFTCKKRSRPHRRRRGGQNHILPGVAAAPIIKRKYLVDDL